MNNEPIIKIKGGLFIGKSSKYLTLQDSKRVGFGSIYLHALTGKVVSSRVISPSVPLAGADTLILKALAIKNPPYIINMKKNICDIRRITFMFISTPLFIMNLTDNQPSAYNQIYYPQ
jgi:hypothetical protein